MKSSIFTTIYQNIENLKLHNISQRVENGETYWTVISIPIMKTVKKMTLGCIIQLLNSTKTWMERC